MAYREKLNEIFDHSTVKTYADLAAKHSDDLPDIDKMPQSIKISPLVPIAGPEDFIESMADGGGSC